MSSDRSVCLNIFFSDIQHNVDKYLGWNMELCFADFSLLTLISSKFSLFWYCHCSCWFCSVGFELQSFFNQRCCLDLELKYESQKNDFVELVNTCLKSVITPLDVILVSLLHTWWLVFVHWNMSYYSRSKESIPLKYEYGENCSLKRFAQYVSW